MFHFVENHMLTVGAVGAWLVTAAAVVGWALGEPGALLGVAGGAFAASCATIAAVLWRRRLRQIEEYERRTSHRQGG